MIPHAQPQRLIAEQILQRDVTLRRVTDGEDSYCISVDYEINSSHATAFAEQRYSDFTSGEFTFTSDRTTLRERRELFNGNQKSIEPFCRRCRIVLRYVLVLLLKTSESAR